MPQFAFGGGALYAVRTDIANASPVRFGALQNVQLDFSGDLKELYGQGQFALALARGKSKIEGKAQFAQINGALFNSLFFGQALTATQVQTAQNEAGTVPSGSGPTLTAVNAATFQSDLGVIYAATALPLTRVASSPAQGQYTVTTGGVYGFATADAGAAVQYSYTYGTSAGSAITISNPPMGQTPVFRAVFVEQYGGKQLTLQLNACVASKLTLPTKQDDWSISELDFQAQADAAGNIGSLSMAE
jgi:hypothetical protein